MWGPGRSIATAPTRTTGAESCSGEWPYPGPSQDPQRYLTLEARLQPFHWHLRVWCPWTSFTEELKSTQPCTDATFARGRP